MTNVVLEWKDPVVKAGIDYIDVQASVDDENYSSIAHVDADVQTLTDQDVQPGRWFYKVIVVPLKGKASNGVKGSIEIEYPQADDVSDLKLSLA